MFVVVLLLLQSAERKGELQGGSLGTSRIRRCGAKRDSERRSRNQSGDGYKKTSETTTTGSPRLSLLLHRLFGLLHRESFFHHSVFLLFIIIVVVIIFEGYTSAIALAGCCCCFGASCRALLLLHGSSSRSFKKQPSLVLLLFSFLLLLLPRYCCVAVYCWWCVQACRDPGFPVIIRIPD